MTTNTTELPWIYIYLLEIFPFINAPIYWITLEKTQIIPLNLPRKLVCDDNCHVKRNNTSPQSKTRRMCIHISITAFPNGANQFDNANNVGPQKEISLWPSFPSLGEESIFCPAFELVRGEFGTFGCCGLTK